jgi:hypothetical protein
MVGCCTLQISNIHRRKNPKVWDLVILLTIQYVLLQPIFYPGNISSKHKWVAMAKCIRALHLAGAIHAAGNEEELSHDRLQYFQEHLNKCICIKVLKKESSLRILLLWVAHNTVTFGSFCNEIGFTQQGLVSDQYQKFCLIENLVALDSAPAATHKI